MTKKLQHPVPPKHQEKIGDIVVSFALLESIIQFFIWSLLEKHQRIGQVITAQFSIRALRTLLLSLYKEKFGEDKDCEKLRGLIKEAGEIEEIRNQIIHSLWLAGKDSNSITRHKITIKEKHGLRFQFENVTSENLADIAEEIQVLAEKIQRFNIEHLEKAK